MTPLTQFYVRLALGFLCVCLTSARAADTFTDRDISRQEVHDAMVAAGIPAYSLPKLAAEHYAEFRRSELMALHAQFRARLSKRIARHDVRFNCFAFSWAFVTEASIALAMEKFHADSAAWRPAVIPVSYVRADGRGHCVLLVITDKGPVWWDAQGGLARPLVERELASIWYPQG